MKRLEADILVIGSGIAGICASLSAKQKGKEVLVLARDGGASAISSGALDLADHPLAIPGKPEQWELNIERNLEEILARKPSHPYHLISGDAQGLIKDFEESLKLVFKENGFLRGDSRKNKLIFNQLGTFKPTAYFQTYLLSLDDLKGKSLVLAVGFKNLAGFDLDFFRKNFLYWTERLGVKIKLEILEIDLERSKTFNSLELSRWLEENSEQVKEKIAGALSSKPADLVIFPSVFPLEKRAEILEEIKRETGAEVRELLALPPSVPGRRLERFLEKRLKEEGIEKIKARAISYKAENKKLLSILARAGKQELEICFDKLVLATGGFLSGGIYKQGDFREGILGLQVFSGSRVLEKKIFTEKLTGLHIVEPHPVFAVGLGANPRLQAIDEQGRVVFENLYLAGSILTGANYIFDGTGGGVALITGLKAGINSSQL